MRAHAAAGDHAFLIMTHRHLDWLPDLVSALDHERSRFVIHVDAKSPDFESAPTEAAVTKGRIHWLPRRRVGWGDFTQVACAPALNRT